MAIFIYVHLKLDKNENPVFRLPQPLVSYLDVVTLRTFPLLQGILDSELLEAELSPLNTTYRILLRACVLFCHVACAEETSLTVNQTERHGIAAGKTGRVHQCGLLMLEY